MERQIKIAVDPATPNKEATAAYKALLAGDLQERARAEGGPIGGGTTVNITNNQVVATDFFGEIDKNAKYIASILRNRGVDGIPVPENNP